MSDKEDRQESGKESLLADMVISPGKNSQSTKGGLVSEPSEGAASKDNFAKQLETTLRQTEADAKQVGRIRSVTNQTESWKGARETVESFKPVPYFVWRLSHFVLGKPGEIKKISEGMVWGLRRLMFAAASDRVLGTDQKTNSMHKALRTLPSDVIAAISVIHAICRRLQSHQFERFWYPILDDAVVRSQIGFFIGQNCPDFGPGRGMLAGFAGRSGLAILIASGELEQARKALELLATGITISDVGARVYDCDPLQVSALTLSASGCGRDAAFGTVGYASEHPQKVVESTPQRQWLAAFTICELARMGKIEEVGQEHWDTLEFVDEQTKDDLRSLVKMMIRRGHGWDWLMQ